MLKYEFFPKASDPPPPLTFGIFEALFSLFPKLFNNNFKFFLKTVLSLLAHWHLFAFDCFRANKKCLKTFGSAGTPPPCWKKLIFEQPFLFVGLPLVRALIYTNSIWKQKLPWSPGQDSCRVVFPSSAWSRRGAPRRRDEAAPPPGGLISYHVLSSCVTSCHGFTG